MRTKSERSRNKRGWNWRIFVISWLIQNKKIVIKRKMTKCEGEINCKGWCDFLMGLAQNSRLREREKK